MTFPIGDFEVILFVKLFEKTTLIEGSHDACVNEAGRVGAFCLWIIVF